MDAKARIRELMQERGWSEYRLAIASGLSQSTVANIFNRNTTPSVATLESICTGFGITLSQFFAQGDMVSLQKMVGIAVKDHPSRSMLGWMTKSSSSSPLVTKSV